MRKMTLDELWEMKRRNAPKRACCGRPVNKPHNLACKAVGGPGVGKWQHRTGPRTQTANKGTE